MAITVDAQGKQLDFDATKRNSTAPSSLKKNSETSSWKNSQDTNPDGTPVTEEIDIDHDADWWDSHYGSNYVESSLQSSGAGTSIIKSMDGFYIENGQIFATVTREDGTTETIAIGNVADLNGMTITADMIDFGAIASNANAALNGNYVMVDENAQQYWGDNGNLTIEIRDDGTVLILENGTAMGFTTLDALLNQNNETIMSSINDSIEEANRQAASDAINDYWKSHNDDLAQHYSDTRDGNSNVQTDVTDSNDDYWKSHNDDLAQHYSDTRDGSMGGSIELSPQAGQFSEGSLGLSFNDASTPSTKVNVNIDGTSYTTDLQNFADYVANKADNPNRYFIESKTNPNIVTFDYETAIKDCENGGLK